MSEPIAKTVSEEVTVENAQNDCACNGESCKHNMWTKHRVDEEIALAFLLALTPLTVLTFFGQIGLL